MPRETIAEIRLSDHPKDLTQKVLRVLRDHGAVGKFSLIEANPEWITESITTGKPIEWGWAQEISRLTPDQLGALIVSRIQERSASSRSGYENSLVQKEG